MNIGARPLGLEGSANQAGSLLAEIKAAVGQLLGASASELEMKGEGARCLHVVGALDKRLAKVVKAKAREHVSQPAGPWTIDLAGVTRWDSEGLAALVYALDVSELNGHQLTLLSPSAPLRLTLERAQLHHLFTIA
jgi:anti-anti-sigma factor